MVNRDPNQGAIKKLESQIETLALSINENNLLYDSLVVEEVNSQSYEDFKSKKFRFLNQLEQIEEDLNTVFFLLKKTLEKKAMVNEEIRTCLVHRGDNVAEQEELEHLLGMVEEELSIVPGFMDL